MVRERQRSRLRRGVQEELIKYFCGGVTARSAAQIAGVNRNTAILFYHKGTSKNGDWGVMHCKPTLRAA